MPESLGMKHRSVLLQEALYYLSPKAGETFIDATFGAGGHSKEILKRIGSRGRLIALDINQEALSHAEIRELSQLYPNLELVNENFSRLKSSVNGLVTGKVDGVIFDLGLSSDMLDDPRRGMSFQSEGPLDMRFDTRQMVTTADLIESSTLHELTKILREYGEEPNASRIAKRIKQGQTPKTTTALYQDIEAALPKPLKHKAKDAARRVFQALRIAVNKELDSLRSGLDQAFELLKPEGRLVAISFHSLEDRIVKQRFNEWAKGCVCPPEAPECVCGKQPLVKILTKKPVTAGEDEVRMNSRARSAKLRAAVKL